MENSGLRDMLSGLLTQRTRKRQLKVAEAFDYLVQEEESRLLDMDQVTRIAVERVEDSGIVFLDEIDKIAGREGGHGPDISREGVQRDILPIVEGTTVNTKYVLCRGRRTTFCLSLPALSMCRSRRTSFRSCRAAFPSAWN